MKFKERTIMQIADMICGNFEADKSFFTYRSSSYLTRFFYDCDTDHSHDGSTRNYWVADVLRKILSESQPNKTTPPEAFLRVIQNLMTQEDAVNEDDERPGAIALLNKSLAREGYEAFYAPDKQCYLRHIATNSIAKMSDSPHRPLSQIEVERRSALSSYMDKISEDELIEEILLPLLRQLGFQRITSAGHKDKAL